LCCSVFFKPVSEMQGKERACNHQGCSALKNLYSQGTVEFTSFL
jgi:hypothetical protein